MSVLVTLHALLVKKEEVERADALLMNRIGNGEKKKKISFP